MGFIGWNAENRIHRSGGLVFKKNECSFSHSKNAILCIISIEFSMRGCDTPKSVKNFLSRLKTVHFQRYTWARQPFFFSWLHTLALHNYNHSHFTKKLILFLFIFCHFVKIGWKRNCIEHPSSWWRPSKKNLNQMGVGIWKNCEFIKKKSLWYLVIVW